MPEYYKYSQRIGINCFTYIEIALENYYEALEIQQNIIDDNYEINDNYLLRMLDKKIMVTIFFSSMALESYLNNYISGCVGDKNYYNIYEKLSWIEKFHLIVQFIYHKEFEKDHVCFTLIKKLEKMRNDLVHNKPKYLQLENTWSLEEIEQFQNSEEYQEYLQHIMKYDKTEVDDLIRIGFDALRTVAEFARFLDNNDTNVQATIDLFWPTLIGKADIVEKAKSRIYPKLGIKLVKVY